MGHTFFHFLTMKILTCGNSIEFRIITCNKFLFKVINYLNITHLEFFIFIRSLIKERNDLKKFTETFFYSLFRVFLFRAFFHKI